MYNYIALNNGGGSASAAAGEGFRDNSGQKLIDTLKRNNNKAAVSFKNAIKSFRIQTRMYKLQKMQTDATLDIAKNLKSFMQTMKDNAQSVKYSSTDDSGTSSNSKKAVSGVSAAAASSDSGSIGGFGVIPLLSKNKDPKIASKSKSIGAMFKKLAKFAAKAFIFTKILDVGYNIFNAYKKAGEYFDTEVPTMTQKISAGLGGAVASITFGMVDAEKSSKVIHKSLKFITGVFDDAIEWIKSTNLYKWGKETANKVTDNATVKSVKDAVKNTYDETTLYWSNKWNELTGNDKSKITAHQTKVGSRATVMPDGSIKQGGSKAWRNNNPGNITGMGGLRYGAAGIAVTSTGDRGDQKQLIFNSREDGVKAFDQLLRDRYTGGSIKDKFAKYQTQGFDAKLASWRKAGIDTNKDIGTIMDEEPGKYKKFRDIMFRHEGEVKGKVIPPNPRDSSSYAMEPDAAREFKIISGAM